MFCGAFFLFVEAGQRRKSGTPRKAGPPEGGRYKRKKKPHPWKTGVRFRFMDGVLDRKV
jgi:hypothetical protein